MSSFTENTHKVPFDTIVDAKGQQYPVSSLSGKVVGLYFSAHWCGPCRKFTPELAAKYNEIVSEGHPFEIIFISADDSEIEANEYFQTMPWKMLPYEDRDAEEDLNAQYHVQGIPTLILLDANGDVMTDNGREIVLSANFSDWSSTIAEKTAAAKIHATKVAALKESFIPSDVFGTEGDVVDKSGQIVTKDRLKDKLVAVYFSGHWCAPCREITPFLAEKYLKLVNSGKDQSVEVIFVSWDNSASDAAAYFEEMPWKMLSFASREKAALLADVFGVDGIPCLVLTDDVSGVISTEGIEAVGSMSSLDKLRDFAAEKQRRQNELDAEMASFPEEVLHPEHPEHPLKKLRSVYDGSYGCDICGDGGENWVYHCGECGFDAHPHCVHPLKEEDEIENDENEDDEA